MTDDPPKDRGDPTRHKWRLSDEMHRLQEERRAGRADRIIRVIRGVVVLAIVVVVLLGGLAFLIKILN
jgi:hypothetical protein